jgi:adenylosuccinate lyase
MRVWNIANETGAAGETAFLDFLKNDPDITAKLSPDALNALFDMGYHLKHVDTIFERVFGSA